MPELRACPGCGVSMQVGAGPHGVAWHDCRGGGPPSWAEAEAAIVAAIVEAAQEATVAELVQLMAALRQHGRTAAAAAGADEGDAGVQDWLQRRPVSG